jgi:predicted nucleotidyltransferase
MQYEGMSTGQCIRERRGEILRVAARHGAGNVRLFGSMARGEDTLESDVDLLVDVTGAALSETFTRTKIAPAYGEAVCYAKDAMTGLSLMNW